MAFVELGTTREALSMFLAERGAMGWFVLLPAVMSSWYGLLLSLALFMLLVEWLLA